MGVSANDFYTDPGLYDLIHADGTDEEVWLLDQIAQTHGNGGKIALEPACGSGRYLEGLLRRRWKVFGYDLSRKMVAYARKRLLRWGDRANIVVGDMATFQPHVKVDLAFNVLSTFRHLMTDRQALSHLRLTAKALNPGGIFILGLDLARYGQDFPDEETWVTRRGGKKITHVMMTLPASARRRRERIMNFVTIATQKGSKLMESAYDLRSYDAQELALLLLKSPFKLVASYGYDGKPAQLGSAQNAFWLVLSPIDRRNVEGKKYPAGPKRARGRSVQ